MKARPGFTLVEVVVALLLLATIVLGLSAATTKMIHASTESARSTVALSLVQERLGQIAADPAYDDLEERYAGVETGELRGVEYRRTTVILHHRVKPNPSSTRVVDWKRVMVTVEEGGREVTRIITVGAP